MEDFGFLAELEDTWNEKSRLLETKLDKAAMLMKNGHDLEALELLKATLPEAKEHITEPRFHVRTMREIVVLLIHLRRAHEALDACTELVAFTKTKIRLDSVTNLMAMYQYALICVHLGRTDESKEVFEDVLTKSTRILGRDDKFTQAVRETMEELEPLFATG